MHIQFITVSMLKLEKPTTAPARPAAALGQVSATLDHNVATLLVGVVKQIRLRLHRDQARSTFLLDYSTNHHQQTYPSIYYLHKAETVCRRRSANVKVRGLLDKVWGQEPDSAKSIENLNVI